MAFLNSLSTAMGIRYIDNLIHNSLHVGSLHNPFQKTKNQNSRKQPFLYYELLKKKLNASSVKQDAVNWEAFIPNLSRDDWEESVSSTFVCPLFTPVDLSCIPL